MEKVTTILAYVGLAVMLVGLGYVCGRRSARSDTVAENATVMDTVWAEIHDTAFVESSVKISRIDTVRLAYVPENAKSGTFGGSNVHENGISGTYTDTLILHDSVYVEVPIERKEFVGDNYRIIAHGFRVGIDEVHISYPMVTATKTQYRSKRWNFSVGAQMGYGYTVHGGSPYVGLGVGFGYTF